MKLKNRNQLADLLNERGLHGSAAFIGCAECYFESYFLDRWSGRAHWIDPWKILDAPGFSGHGEDTDEGQEARYQRILKTAAKYNGRAKVMRATSEEAAPRFNDGSLDFVYIDALHTRKGSADDIRWWSPKVRSAGILAGHDYLSGFFNGQEYGVRDSVEEFASARNLAVHVIPEEWPSWWMVKP